MKAHGIENPYSILAIRFHPHTDFVSSAAIDGLKIIKVLTTHSPEILNSIQKNVTEVLRVVFMKVGMYFNVESEILKICRQIFCLRGSLY